MKRVLFSSILALLIIGGIAFSYFYYQKYRIPQTDAFALMPKDAFLIIEAEDLFNAIERSRESTVWSSLYETGVFKNWKESIAKLDSIGKDNETIRTILSDRPIYASAHLVGASGFDMLLMISLSPTESEGQSNALMQSFFGTNNSSKRLYEGIQIREIKIQEHTFAFAVVGKLMLCSFSSFLVEDAIRQYKIPKSSSIPHPLELVREAAGKKVEANIYINYEQLARVTNIYLKQEHSELTSPLNQFARWSAFDVQSKSNSISFAGFSSYTDSSDYLSIFSEQTPQKIELVDHLPWRTALFKYTAFSDFETMNAKQYFLRKGLNEDENERAILEKTKGKKGIEVFLPWLGNEYALVVTDLAPGNFDNNSFAVFKCTDSTLAKQSLSGLNHKISSNSDSTAELFLAENYKGRTIDFLNVTGLLPYVFGEDFKNMDNVFYTFIGSYIVFANQASALRSYADDIDSKRLLSTESFWKEMINNLSATANRFVYIDVNRSQGYLSNIADTAMLKASKLASGLSAFTYQASGSGQLIYTHALLYRSSIAKSAKQLLWAALLDTSISSKPTILENLQSGEKEILIQDDANTLYLINSLGEILLRIPLKEKIISEIFQVDYFRNDKWQFLFNTSSAVYLIDRNGEKVKNYPIKLPFAATTGMKLFDYEGKKEYRWFVPCINNKLYAYQLNGKRLEGWKFNELLNYIEFPLQYFKLADAEFLVLSDTVGAVFILDRTGKNRISVKKSLDARMISPFTLVQGRTIAESRLVSADNKGNIHHIYFTGEVLSHPAPEELEYNSFAMLDMNSDNSPEYILQDSVSLKVVALDSTLIFSHTFQSPVLSQAIPFKFSNARGKIGLASVESNEIYLLNDNGSMYPGFPMKGSTEFLLSESFVSGRRIVLVGSKDKYLYLYSIE